MGATRVTVFPGPREFLDVARSVLAEHEAEHHLVLGVAEAFASGDGVGPAPFAAVIADDAGFVLAAWMEQAHPLLVASDRSALAPAADRLIDVLGERSLTPSHVIGAVGQIEAFVDRWTSQTERTARVVMRQRGYKLDAVQPIALPAGQLRAATTDDLDLVAAWQHAFHVEALRALALPEDRSRARRRVAAGEVYLWCDGEGRPRAMAGSTRPTANGIAVNAVYTPPEDRGRGYATACVAELSRRLLGSGYRFCVLYTDLANPTSNAIYTRIGYRPIRDFLMYSLASN